jgi:hypothetical protein
VIDKIGPILATKYIEVNWSCVLEIIFIR